MTTESTKAKGPAFVQWFGPLLEALRELGGSATPKEAVDAVARICRLPAAQREEILKSGVERFDNQVRWARQYLVWDGLIESGKRGIWALSSAGLKTELNHIQALELFERVQRQQTAPGKKSPEEKASTVQHALAVDDSEQADEESEQARFIAVLQSLSAAGFERLCLRLLREAGFDRLEVTGRSNDGGIDGVGVLQVNDLVSFNVVFQCKKWMSAVPPKEIRDLRGAMAGRADKAIFLTTSHFSQNAKDEAIRAGADPIELVDGEKLYAMFRKYELGLKPRMVYDIDEAFFKPFRA